MAASGIAEHNEARRREMVYLRKAFLSRQANEQKANLSVHQQATNPAQNGPMMYRSGAQQSAPAEDPLKKYSHYETTAQADYSAKIPYRYSSNDYISQW